VYSILIKSLAKLVTCSGDFHEAAGEGRRDGGTVKNSAAFLLNLFPVIDELQ